MHGHSSKLVILYILVGIITISSLVYSLDFKLSDIRGGGSGETTTSSDVYELSIGQGKTIKGIVYTFGNVISDNRCPKEETCATMGSAEIEVQIGVLGSSENLRVTTDGPSTYANIAISIESLTPTPVSNTNEAKVKLKIVETN